MGRGRRQGYQKVNSKNKTTPQQKTKTEIKIKNQENQIGKKGKGKKTKENLKWKKEKKKKKEKCPRIKQGSIGPGLGAVWEEALGFWKEKAARFGVDWGRGRALDNWPRG